MKTNNSHTLTGRTTIKKGTVLMDVYTRAKFTLPEDKPARMGVHPGDHETVYYIDGRIYFNEWYTKAQK
jgi:hypothetical protein